MELTQILAHDTTPEGEELLLVRRNSVFTLRVDGIELMTSRAHGSEEAVARRACDLLESVPEPRVLIGGLGFGFTLRAALDALPESSSVIVCELFELLLEWNRESLGRLAGWPLEDPRVIAVHADVQTLLTGEERFDAIILDVDNGPWGFTLKSNDALYSSEGIARIARCLEPGGVLTVWSSEPSPEYARRLARGGFSVAVETVEVDIENVTLSHTLFIGTLRGRQEPGVLLR